MKATLGRREREASTHGKEPKITLEHFYFPKRLSTITADTGRLTFDGPIHNNGTEDKTNAMCSFKKPVRTIIDLSDEEVPKKDKSFASLPKARISLQTTAKIQSILIVILIGIVIALVVFIMTSEDGCGARSFKAGELSPSQP